MIQRTGVAGRRPATAGADTGSWPRTASAGRIGSVCTVACPSSRREDSTGGRTRTTDGLASRPTASTRPTRNVPASPMLPRRRLSAASGNGCRCVRREAGNVRDTEPISMPPPEPGRCELAVTSTGGVAAVAAAAGGGAGGDAAGVGLGGLAVDGAAGSGSGCGAGGASGAGGGKGAPRDGRSVRGSTYVSLAPTRTPRWTYGTGCSASPVGPASARTSPSETVAPRRTRSDPRCVSDTLASPIAIVTVSPLAGTWPANVTSPETGARTDATSPSATSTPRC
jgi:hypothetical protein